MAPLTTTKNGTALSPTSTSTSPAIDRAAASVRRDPRDLRGGERRKQPFRLRRGHGGLQRQRYLGHEVLIIDPFGLAGLPSFRHQ